MSSIRFPTQTHEYGAGEREGDVDGGAAAREGPEARAGHEQRPLHLEALPARRQRHPRREEPDRRRRLRDRCRLRRSTLKSESSSALSFAVTRFPARASHRTHTISRFVHLALVNT